MRQIRPQAKREPLLDTRRGPDYQRLGRVLQRTANLSSEPDGEITNAVDGWLGNTVESAVIREDKK